MQDCREFVSTHSAGCLGCRSNPASDAVERIRIFSSNTITFGVGAAQPCRAPKYIRFVTVKEADIEIERWRNRHFVLQYEAMECSGLQMLW